MKYLSFVKFSHSIFSLPFALIGFLEALKVRPDADLIWLSGFTLLALVSARTAAMGFNRIVDRHIDAKNERTAKRELPSGRMSIAAAWLVVMISIVVFIFSAYKLNMLAFYLSPVALFVILSYSYTKRFTSLSHFILGMGLGIAPVAAFIAVTGNFSIPLIFLGVGVMLWTAGFDIIYALQDLDFDKKENLHSIPVKLGEKNSKILALLTHIVSTGLIIYFWFGYSGKVIPGIGTLLFSILVFYQHIIVHRHGLSKINLAFFTLNGMAGLLLGLAYLIEFLI
ncbi:MAG: 4-hydroxybenzoate octaprenyltransferase [Marinilabiliales bacterium]|nr:MAG: 4-hydroxybenzoate octaprenyltransferase [Marinilabiliales bacterium]